MKKITLILISLILVLTILIIASFYYSRSQLKFGVEVVNEHVNAVFENPQEREKYGIPSDVELKEHTTTYIDYGIRSAELIYPCKPEGHLYVTFNTSKGILFLSLFNKKEDFNIQISEYNPKNVEEITPSIPNP